MGDNTLHGDFEIILDLFCLGYNKFKTKTFP